MQVRSSIMSGWDPCFFNQLSFREVASGAHTRLLSLPAEFAQNGSPHKDPGLPLVQLVLMKWTHQAPEVTSSCAQRMVCMHLASSMC